MKQQFYTGTRQWTYGAGMVLGVLFVFFVFVSVLSAETAEREELPIGVNFTGAQLESLKPAVVKEKVVNEDDASKTVVTEDGLYFRLARDRPIEKIAQAIRPIRLDSYLYAKFERLQEYIDARFDQLESRLSIIETDITDLKRMMSQMLAEQKKLET